MHVGQKATGGDFRVFGIAALLDFRDDLLDVVVSGGEVGKFSEHCVASFEEVRAFASQTLDDSVATSGTRNFQPVVLQGFRDAAFEPRQKLLTRFEPVGVVIVNDQNALFTTVEKTLFKRRVELAVAEPTPDALFVVEEEFLRNERGGALAGAEVAVKPNAFRSA